MGVIRPSGQGSDERVQVQYISEWTQWDVQIPLYELISASPRFRLCSTPYKPLSFKEGFATWGGSSGRDDHKPLQNHGEDRPGRDGRGVSIPILISYLQISYVPCEWRRRVYRVAGSKQHVTYSVYGRSLTSGSMSRCTQCLCRGGMAIPGSSTTSVPL